MDIVIFTNSNEVVETTKEKKQYYMLPSEADLGQKKKYSYKEIVEKTNEISLSNDFESSPLKTRIDNNATVVIQSWRQK